MSLSFAIGKMIVNRLYMKLQYSIASLLNNLFPGKSSVKTNFIITNYRNILYCNNSLNACKPLKTIFRIQSFGTQYIKDVNETIKEFTNDLLIKNNHLHMRRSLKKIFIEYIKSKLQNKELTVDFANVIPILQNCKPVTETCFV